MDEIVTVLAGGLLWLDCSSLASKSDNLMVVGWRKEYYKFYNQYNNAILGDNFGFPLNITEETIERGGMSVISICLELYRLRSRSTDSVSLQVEPRTTVWGA